MLQNKHLNIIFFKRFTTDSRHLSNVIRPAEVKNIFFHKSVVFPQIFYFKVIRNLLRVKCYPLLNTCKFYAQIKTRKTKINQGLGREI